MKSTLILIINSMLNLETTRQTKLIDVIKSKLTKFNDVI